MTDRQDIVAAIAAIVADLTGEAVASVAPDQRFDAIPRWDSLKHIELLACLEERFDFRFPAREIDRLHTVADAVRVVCQCRDAATGTPAP